MEGTRGRGREERNERERRKEGRRNRWRMGRIEKKGSSKEERELTRERKERGKYVQEGKGGRKLL